MSPYLAKSFMKSRQAISTVNELFFLIYKSLEFLFYFDAWNGFLRMFMVPRLNTLALET